MVRGGGCVKGGLRRERDVAGAGMGGSEPYERADPPRSLRRRGARVPGDRPLAGAARVRPRGRRRDLGAMARAGRGARPALPGGRGVHGLPPSSSRLAGGSGRGGAGARAAVRGVRARARDQRHPDAGAVARRRAARRPARDPDPASLSGAPARDAVLRVRRDAAAQRPRPGGLEGRPARARGRAAARSPRAQRDAPVARAGADRALPRRHVRGARPGRDLSRSSSTRASGRRRSASPDRSRSRCRTPRSSCRRATSRSSSSPRAPRTIPTAT